MHWNTEGFKYGICNTPPVNQDYSLLCLANNTCVRDKFQQMRSKFLQLYKRKSHTHNFTKFMEADHFDETLNAVEEIIAKYESIETEAPKPVKRLKPLYL